MKPPPGGRSRALKPSMELISQAKFNANASTFASHYFTRDGKDSVSICYYKIDAVVVAVAELLSCGLRSVEVSRRNKIGTNQVILYVFRKFSCTYKLLV